MATGDRTQAPVPNVGINQRFDKVDHQLIADTFSEHAETTHRTLVSEPIASAGAPVGELWVGSITSNPVTDNDDTIQVDSAFLAGLDADGGVVIVPEGTALQAAIPSDSSNYQVYLYTSPVSENSQVRRYMPAGPPFNEFAQATDIHARRLAALHIRSGGVGSTVASDLAAGETRPLLLLGIANNTGTLLTFAPVVNRLETVTVPSNLPASSTGDVDSTPPGVTYSTGDQATVRGMVNAAMHAVARDRWQGSNNYAPSAANNYGAYTETPAGLDVAVREHLDYVTIGEDSSSSFGTFNRDDYVSDDLLLDAAIAALPADGGVIFIKPGFTLDNFASDVTIPANTRVTFQSDIHRSIARVTFNLDTYKFVCPSGSGGDQAKVEFRDCTFSTTHASHTGEIIELHDDVDLVMQGCFVKVDTVNTAAAVGCITVNAACTNLGNIVIDDCSVSFINATTTITGVYFMHTPSTVVAHDILVRNSTFVCTGDGATEFGGSVISIEEVGPDIRILSSDFSSLGSTLATGDQLVAIRLTSSNNAEFFRHNRVIDHCTFQGRETALLGALIGIFATDVQDLSITNCQFQSCYIDITYRQTGSYSATDVNFQVLDCTFRDTATFGLLLIDSITFKDMKVRGCVFYSSHFKFDSGSGSFEDFSVLDNTFHDTPFSLSAAVLMKNCHVDNNLFVTTTDDLAAPILGRDLGGSSVVALSFDNNTVRGYHSTTSVGDHVFGVKVRGGSGADISISGNKFYDLQDTLTWVGATDPGDNWHIVSVRIGTCTGAVRIQGNTFGSIATNITDSGAGTLNMPYLIHMSNRLRDTSGGSYESVSISGNVCGDVVALPLYMEDTKAQILRVESNIWRYFIDVLLPHHVTAGGFGGDFLFVTNSTSLAYNHLVFRNNTINRIDGGISYGDFIVQTGSTQWASTFDFSGNTVEFEGAITANEGIFAQGAPNNLMFIGNLSDVGTTLQMGSYPGTIASNPDDPGSGNPYPDNVRFVRF